MDEENIYAPPGVSDERDGPEHQEGEAWTLGSCFSAATRASLQSPVFAWIGLGIIPNLSTLLDLLLPADTAQISDAHLLSLAISAVLTGGQLKIALALIRNEPPSFRVFASYARLAPGFFMLTLPALVPSMIAFAITDPLNVPPLLMFGFLPASLFAVYFTYKLGLAAYAFADSAASLKRAVGHSWKRTGASAGKFVTLFLVTGLPNLVSYGLAYLVPVAGTLFNIATLPLITLCWTHAYDAGLDTEAEGD